MNRYILVFHEKDENERAVSYYDTHVLGAIIAPRCELAVSMGGLVG